MRACSLQHRQALCESILDSFIGVELLCDEARKCALTDLLSRIFHQRSVINSLLESASSCNLDPAQSAFLSAISVLISYLDASLIPLKESSWVHPLKLLSETATQRWIMEQLYDLACFSWMGEPFSRLDGLVDACTLMDFLSRRLEECMLVIDRANIHQAVPYYLCLHKMVIALPFFDLQYHYKGHPVSLFSKQVEQALALHRNCVATSTILSLLSATAPPTAVAVPGALLSPLYK